MVRVPLKKQKLQLNKEQFKKGYLIWLVVKLYVKVKTMMIMEHLVLDSNYRL